MPRDYAKTSSRSDKPGQLPGWVWMLGGLAVGLFVAFLVYLNKNVDPAKQTKIIDAVIETASEGEEINKQRQQQREVEQKNNPVEDEKEFDFYELLPATDERRVTEQEIERRTTGTDKAPQKTNVDYYVQVGSFKKLEQAQQFRADLLLKGIEPNIQSVKINDVTWHRVIIGPIRDLEKLNDTRVRLRENNIRFVVMEKKG